MRNKWFVAYKKRGKDLFDTEGFKLIDPPQGTYQADPFVFSKEGERKLFIEDYDYSLGKLSVYNLDAEGKPTSLQTVMEGDYHFSYPFIFDYQGETWLVPETGKHGSIDLYKCDVFPHKWSKVKTLIQAPGYDSTLFEKDGKLWMFTTLGDDHDLAIFYADDLLGDWSLHSRSRHLWSRSAGKLFYHEGKLLRPTQDCSKCYGHALIFKEIQINEQEYTEKVYKRIEPDWLPGLIGTHTFSFDDEFVYIDGKIQVEQ